MDPESKELDKNERFERLERQMKDLILKQCERLGLSCEISQEPIEIDVNTRMERLECMAAGLCRLNSKKEFQNEDLEIPYFVFEPVPKPIPIPQNFRPLINQDPLVVKSESFDTDQILENSRQHSFRPLTQLKTIRNRTTFISSNSLYSTQKKQALIELFREYVKARGAVHKNRLDFYFACEGLKQQTDSTTITNMTISIYRFLLRSKIKVSDEIRSVINSALRGYSSESNVFDPILEIVKNVIYETTYKDFCSTNICFGFLDFTSTSFPFFKVIAAQEEQGFPINLLLIRFTRYKFSGNNFQLLIITDLIRYECICYIRNRHLEWEVAWKKNFDKLIL